MIKALTMEQFLKLENLELKKTNLELNIEKLENQIFKLHGEYDFLCKKEEKMVEEYNILLGVDISNYKIKDGVLIDSTSGQPINFPETPTE